MTRAAGLASKAASLLALLGALAFSPVFCAAQQTGPSTWVLVYAGGPTRPSYSVSDFVHLIASIDRSGKPAGWLSTGTIFLEAFAPSGRVFATWIGGQFADGNDWSAYLHMLFDPTGALRRLNSAVALVSGQAGSLREKFPVVIMIPYPDTSVSELDVPWGKYSLASIDGRLQAADAYITEVVSRFRQNEYANLRLTGFYWLKESIWGDDIRLTSDVAKRIHQLGLRFFWIPFYASGPNVVLWARIGFDQAWLQPNYFFNLGVSALRLDSAVSRARSLGMGLEVEFNGRLFSGQEYFNRLDPYLTALERASDLRQKSVVIFEGGGALIRLSSSTDSVYRALYSRLVETLQVER